MIGSENSAPSIPAIAASSRFPRWLVAIGLGVPFALIALAASPLGNDFLYVVIGIPALLLTWALAGVGALVLSLRCAMRKEWRRCVCAVRRRRFPVGASPTRRTLQPEATGAVMEVTKWLKPSV
jgi:hypothetical protein